MPTSKSMQRTPRAAADASLLSKGGTMKFVLPLVAIAVAIALGLTAAEAEDKAAWKPEAADLLFSSTRDGNSEVYVLRAGQKEWINLSNHQAGDNWPVWSPDGKTILFTSWRKHEGEEKRAPHIYAMDADGSNPRRLVRESLNTSDGATWSADGRTIVFSRKGEKGADVYLADSDGTNERRITFDQDRNLHNGSATLSPDGKSIAFYSDNETSAALNVIGVDGKNRRAIVAEDAKPILLVGGPKREVEGTWRPMDTPQDPYDAALAKSVGADERGMRKYVLVVLKSGPTKVPAGEKRTEMFKGHMANIKRLASEGLLVLAGPLDGVDGWRGLFVFATPDIATAKTHVETDPVIVSGEMVAEYHEFYGSAALMMVNELQRKLSKGSP